MKRQTESGMTKKQEQNIPVYALNKRTN
jgi:hypothetical protein